MNTPRHSLAGHAGAPTRISIATGSAVDLATLQVVLQTLCRCNGGEAARPNRHSLEAHGSAGTSIDKSQAGHRRPSIT